MRSARHRWFAIVVLVASSGCYLAHDPLTDRPSSARVPRIEASASCSVHPFRAGRKFDPVDMVWVVDSSNSMADQQERIHQTINDFVSSVEARHFDVHLVMVTETDIVPAPLGSDASRYLFVQRIVNSHEPLMALLDTLPRYRDFLRPNAALHFVIVTDDNSSVSADAFREAMTDQLRRPFVVHAVASPDVDGQPCRDENAPATCASTGSARGRATCGASAIGREYYALAEQSGGEEISICIDDWSMVLSPLLEAVGRTEIPCIVDLSEQVLSDTQVTLAGGSAGNVLVGQVDGAESCGQQLGFYFTQQALSTRLVLCPVACGSTTLDDVELRIAIGCNTP